MYSVSSDNNHKGALWLTTSYLTCNIIYTLPTSLCWLFCDSKTCALSTSKMRGPNRMIEELPTIHKACLEKLNKPVKTNLITPSVYIPVSTRAALKVVIILTCCTIDKITQLTLRYTVEPLLYDLRWSYYKLDPIIWYLFTYMATG